MAISFVELKPAEVWISLNDMRSILLYSDCTEFKAIIHESVKLTGQIASCEQTYQVAMLNEVLMT